MTQSTYVLLLEYDGSNFAGFQIQPNIATVQSELEKALSIILREPIKVYCSGRTDAGVHATGQIAHFQTNATLPAEKRLCQSLGGLLPSAIMVHHVSPVSESFHARFTCIAREYEYLIWNSPTRRALCANQLLWVREPLNLDFLNQQAQALIGEHDFTSFTRPLTEKETPMRYIDQVGFRRTYDPISNSNNVVVFRIRGNAFLHNMIRILIGTLLDIHNKNIQHSLVDLISLQDRTQAGITAKPIGLYFRHAFYLQNSKYPDWLPQLEDYPWMKKNQAAR